MHLLGQFSPNNRFPEADCVPNVVHFEVMMCHKLVEVLEVDDWSKFPSWLGNKENVGDEFV